MAVAESGEETWTPPDGAVPSSTAPLSTRFNQSRIAFSGSDAQAQIGAEIDALLCKPPGAWYAGSPDYGILPLHFESNPSHKSQLKLLLAPSPTVRTIFARVD